MRSFINALLILILAFAESSYGQTDRQADSLQRIVLQSKTDEDKVNSLNNLADYYYGKKLYLLGDSVLEQQLYIAELSNNNDLVLKTYFENNRTSSIASWSPREEFEKASKFILDGISYAKSVNNNDYVALGYSRMAGILRKNSNPDNAVDYAMNAVNLLQNIVSDSIKAIVYIELGDSYHAKKQSVEACKSYNNAYVIALKSENHFLESNIYHKLSDLYFDLGEKTEAKNQLMKSVGTNRKSGNSEGLLWDYVELARVTDDSRYVERAMFLADSLNIYKYNIRIKNIMFAIYMVNKESKKALDFLNSNPDLKQSFIRFGIGNYYFQLGEIFRYGNQPDSALHYFKLAEPDMLKNFSLAQVLYIYLEIAACYGMKNEMDNEIIYYEKTLKYSKETGNIENIAMISDSLSRLYQEKGDYKQAYDLKLLATITKDSLAQLSKERDIALLGLNRESRKLEEGLLQEQQRLRNQRNLQYMGITIAISVVFLFMLILGTFAVSKLTIKILGYFFFISLFEFFVLVLDNEILFNFTHGQPFRLWLIKIFLIGSLVPLQQWLEHTLIKFLESRQLIRARTQFSIRKLWIRNKTRKRKSALKTAKEMDAGIM